nr:GNAT family N-acetyltransferase [uncultured Draconibacterium sp.]
MKIRDFKIEDLSTLKIWLEQDYISRFWGNIQEWIDEITENLDADWVKCFIVEHNDKPIGFLQYYETDNAPPGDWSSESVGTVGIDYLIGNRNYIGKGYGSKIVQLLVELIKSKNEYDYIIADPVKENLASIKTLENNDFYLSENGLYKLDLNK